VIAPHHRWDTLTTEEARALGALDPVVVLPVAATEQHGPHLPLGTDVLIGDGILEAALRILPGHVPVRVLPGIRVGASEEHLSFPGTLSLPPELLLDTVVRIGRAVSACGVRRLILWNSHGGNRGWLEGAALRLRRETGMRVARGGWTRFGRPAGVELPESEWKHGLHGGAVETAMLLHLHPDLVRLDQIRPAPSLGEEMARTFRRLGPEGEAAFAWLAEDLNPSGAIGDPTLATPEMGARLVEAYAGALVEVLEEMRRMEVG